MFLFTQYAVACKQTVSINVKTSTLTSLDDHRHEIPCASVLPSALAGDRLKSGARKGIPLQ